MTKFNIKRVPKGFYFPVQTKELKKFIKSFGELFRIVDLNEISSCEKKGSLSPKLGRFWVGIVTATKNEMGWFFDLKLQALREKHISEHKDVITQIIFNDISDWIEKKISSKETDPEEPRRLFLSFENKDKKIISASHEVRLDK